MQRKIAYRNLPQLLLRARETFLCHFRPIITHFGLTEQQWRILRAVAEYDQLEPREICEICQILSPSLAGVLARMEEVGLVTRTRMAEDQRRVIVRLTARSEQLVAEMSPLIEEQYVMLEQAIDPALMKALYDLMDRVVEIEDTPVRHVSLPELNKKTDSRNGLK